MLHIICSYQLEDLLGYFNFVQKKNKEIMGMSFLHAEEWQIKLANMSLQQCYHIIYFIVFHFNEKNFFLEAECMFDVIRKRQRNNPARRYGVWIFAFSNFVVTTNKMSRVVSKVIWVTKSNYLSYYPFAYPNMLISCKYMSWSNLPIVTLVWRDEHYIQLISWSTLT